MTKMQFAKGASIMLEWMMAAAFATFAVIVCWISWPAVAFIAAVFVPFGLLCGLYQWSINYIKDHPDET